MTLLRHARRAVPLGSPFLQKGGPSRTPLTNQAQIQTRSGGFPYRNFFRILGVPEASKRSIVSTDIFELALRSPSGPPQQIFERPEIGETDPQC